jgi:NAD(P)-dependent dehydrogenase (short-subunit alcohol dehydrogenase family)
MKNYLAVFLGSQAAMAQHMAQDPAVLKETDKKGFDAWMKWAQDHQADIVNMGSPLGRTKVVNKAGITDTRNEMGAWCVVQANSHEEAAKMFENHPHFMIFPGDRVEVMEMMPIPTM